MNRTLFFKLLRDIRWSFFLVALLLFIFQVLWSKITDRVTSELLPAFAGANISPEFLKNILFKGPGKLIQNLIGGEGIGLDRVSDLLTIAYVHPFTQTVFSMWAIGRGAGALAGESDRGTMELLLAQPIPRRQVVLTHLAVDLFAIPLLCLAVMAGTYLGTATFGLQDKADISRFPPALLNVAALMFAISGYTLAISAAGRFRWRVVSLALGVTLVQFLINLLGQLWDVLEPFRPLTVFYYYQPQAIILSNRWTTEIGRGLPGMAEGEYLFRLHAILVLFVVGVIGYAAALWTFQRKDLPAPL